MGFNAVWYSVVALSLVSALLVLTTGDRPAVWPGLVWH